MSHIVKIQTQFRDPAAISAACRRLGLPEPATETVRLYSGRAAGLAVKLPGWRYPIVIDVAGGEVQFDNFGGLWGDQQELDRFRQSYAVEKAKLEARKRGHTVTEQRLADGSIKVSVQVAGGAA